MIAAAFAAAEQIFTPPFRAVFWKSVGLTLLLLAFFGAGIEKLVVIYVHLPWAWAATAVHFLTGIGLVAGVAFLVTPVCFFVAGFFFDELAGHVEEDMSGKGGRGRTMPVAPALWIGLKFGLLSLLVNMAALALLLVPVVNLVAFFCANAYLFGRGFFELAALRYRPMPQLRRLRQTHALRIFLAGCLPAVLALVPLVNLLTPLYATALLVRIAHPLVSGDADQTS